MANASFAARVWAKLIGFERDHSLMTPGGRVLVGVSGGPDSVCLAHYIKETARRRGGAVELMHVHHGLRGRAADGDAKFVTQLGLDMGLKTHIVRVDVRRAAAKAGQGIEDAARRERYRALINRARRGRFAAVAVGHHLDDQAETVILHLLRGTSLKGLGAMAPKRPLAGKINLIRPLLCLTRAEVEEYLRAHELKFRRDETNDDPKFLRNWVRREVLPLLQSRAPRIKARLAIIAEQARIIGS